jgi:hypothetical protein
MQVIIAESYGGNDEPVDVLAQSLTNAGAELVVNPLRVKELPQQALYQQFEEAGERAQVHIPRQHVSSTQPPHTNRTLLHQSLHS